MESKFVTHRMNTFQIFFGNGFGISTIWGAMTYSDNYDLRLPIGESEKPLAASEFEIMFIGKDLPPSLAKQVSEVLGEKNCNDDVNGPYGMVTVEEWMKVANLLNEYISE